MRLKSPYEGDWSFGRPPVPVEGMTLVVVVPDIFVGLVVQSDKENTRWVGGDIHGRLVISENGWWCHTLENGEWTGWEDINVWWQVV